MIDLYNSSSKVLGGSETFTGKYVDISSYSSISILGSSDVVGTLYCDFSIDGVTAERTLQLSGGDTTDYGVHTLIPVSRYFRIRVVNGVTAQGAMSVQTLYSTEARISLPTSRNNQELKDYSNVLNTRSILVGETSGGVYKNISVESSTNKLDVAVPRTAFGNVSCSLQTHVIQLNFIYNINTDVVDTTTTGIGSVSQSNSMASISTGAQSSSSAKVSSKRVIKYRAGQGCHIVGSAIFTTGVVGSTQLFGVGDDVNGLFFGYNGSAFGILHRINSVNTWTAQTSWNGDKMDGNGDSGITLDTTKGNIYMIQYQWLGFGIIKFNIEDSNTGEFVAVHKIKYSNTYTSPSSYNPTYSIMWESKNTTNTSDIVVKGSSCSGEVEGNIIYLGPRKSVGNSKTGVTTTLTNIITINNKTTFASIANKVSVNILKYSAAVDATKPVEYQIILNTTLGGSPNYTDIGTNTSVIEYDTAGTTISGGTVLDFGTIAKEGSINEKLDVEDIVIQPGDSLTFAIRATHSTVDVTCSFQWVEDI